MLVIYTFVKSCQIKLEYTLFCLHLLKKGYQVDGIINEYPTGTLRKSSNSTPSKEPLITYL